MPPTSRYIVSCAFRGAFPLKSSTTVSPRLARWITIVPAPAIVDMNGSTTVIASAVATAASTALPPRARIVAPTSAPTSCSAATRPPGANGVFVVMASEERIMSRLSFATLLERVFRRQVLHEIDHLVLVHEHPPPERVQPRLAHLVLHRRPVLAGEFLELLDVRHGRFRRAEQDRHLLLGHADRHLLVEPEPLHLERIGDFGVLYEEPADALVRLIPPRIALFEGRRAAGALHDLRHPDLLGLRTVGRPLLDRPHRGASGEHEQHDDDPEHGRKHTARWSRSAAASPRRSERERVWGPRRGPHL